MSKFINLLKNKLKVLLGIDPRSQLEIDVANGLKIKRNCLIMENVVFDHSHCWLIEIGENVVVAPQCYFLAHDASTKRSLGYTSIGRVIVGDNCFIGARSIIMPGVRIGNNCIVGAGSVVTKSVAAGSVVAGNPARTISTTKEYFEKRKHQLNNSPQYGRDYTISFIDEQKKRQMISDLKDTNGFII